MALIGSIEVFNPKESDVMSYIERLEQLFICNEVEKEKKVPLFLTLIGGEAYGILKDILAPTTLSTLSYENLKKALIDHYCPKRLVISERYKFYMANQESVEDVKAYAAKLKSLAKFCEFGNFLNEALRDKFVCGLRLENLRRKLLTEDNLTYERAYQIAVAMELAEGESKVMIIESASINKLNKLKFNKSQSNSSQGYSNYKIPQLSRRSHSSNFNKERQPGMSNQTINKAQCKRCLYIHENNRKCPAIYWKCYACDQMGHTAKSMLCKNKVHELEIEDDEEQFVKKEDRDEDSLELGFLEHFNDIHRVEILKGDKETESLKVRLPVSNKLLVMEIDSGACKSVIHADDYHGLFHDITLEMVTFKLRVVTGESVTILGQILVDIEYQQRKWKLPLVVLDCSTRFVPLLGRNWLSVLNPNWKNLVDANVVVKSLDMSVVESDKFNPVTGDKNETVVLELKNKFQLVFKTDPKSYIKGFKANIKLKEGARPIFQRAYEMPYALKQKVEVELIKMVESGILSKVNSSSWASPIVVVPKKNTSEIRICVDFKRTLNTVIDTDHCILPLPNDIFANLSNSTCFTVIDLKSAYQQLLINDSSKEFFTINTHLGLFRYNRLTYGVSSAPGIFQVAMETILANLQKVHCYLDDIFIHGKNFSECYQNVINVLNRLKEYNVKVNPKKCLFFKPSVQFLGHIVDAQGIHPTKEKIECIENAPTPKNITQLRSYLGLLNYYRKYIPMLSTKLKSLYDLCKVNSSFSWSDDHEKCFELSKKLVTSDDVLTFYDPSLPIYITCDSSGYGVGAVLSHRSNKMEKPVLFASATLSKAEQQYSNLEREALAIMFGVNKFHKYIFGRKFILVTDHQPLKFIFGSHKGVPVTAAARITRWAITLSAYNYDIEYKKGSLISNADSLSRLPANNDTGISNYLYSFNTSEHTPLNSADITLATQHDPILNKVFNLTLSGWPNSVSDEKLKPFWKKRNELSIENNCILLGSKVVIPTSLQQDILKLFHEQHLGIVRTKMLLRGYCWWVGINEDIEKFISMCEICQQTQNFSNSCTLLPWPSAPNNFYRCYIDLFYKFKHTFLILVDQKTKWIEVKLMNEGTTANEIILKLKEIFSIFGLPVELVSDNGPPFNSDQFVKFCQSNGIKPVKTPPYHPQSNGLAERSVQTVKKGLERSLFLERGKDINRNTILNRLANFLFTYRNTPSTVTGIPPSQNVFKIKPRTRFDLIRPMFHQVSTKPDLGVYRKTKLYSLNDNVYVKDNQLKLWRKGKIVKVLSYCTYLVQLQDSVKLVHANDIRLNESAYADASPVQSSAPSTSFENSASSCITSPNVPSSPITTSNTSDNFNSKSSYELTEECENIVHNTPSHTPHVSQSTVTRSGRVIRPPLKLNL